MLADEIANVGDILSDATDRIVSANVGFAVEGYAAHGASMRTAVEPLVEHLGLDLSDGSDRIEARIPTLYEVAHHDMGCAPDGKSEARIERTMLPDRAIPASLTIDYYDPARDFQVGRMRASAASRTGPAESVDLPIVLGADAARGLAEDSLARRWAQRERLTLRLPPQLLGLRTGDVIRMPESARLWTVRQVTFEALVAVAELQPAWTPAPAITADPGRPVPSPDRIAGPTRLALLDLPDLGGGSVLQLHLAAASSTATWRSVPIEIGMGGAVTGSTSAASEAVMGSALTHLPAGTPDMFDTAGTVDIELANDEQWLESRDDDALLGGANLAVLGDELFQFGSAVAIGPKRFRLARLLRGRFGSEWAIGLHSAGDPFVLLDGRGLRAIFVPDALAGLPIDVVAHGLGDGVGTSVSMAAVGEALRPPAPVHLRAGLSGGGLEVTWVRRSRAGYAWPDEIDAPLGEAMERYRVRLSGSEVVEIETSARLASFDSAQLAVVGSGPATVSVAMVGDRALSRWTAISLTL